MKIHFQEHLYLVVTVNENYDYFLVKLFKNRVENVCKQKPLNTYRFRHFDDELVNQRMKKNYTEKKMKEDHL